MSTASTKLFADDGLLGDANVRSKCCRRRADEIDEAIIAESARWGDAKRSDSVHETDWDRAVQNHISVDQRSTRQGAATADERRLVARNGDPADSPGGGQVAAGTIVTIDGTVEQRIEDDVLSSSSFLRYVVPDAALDNRDRRSDWTDPDFSDYNGWKFGGGDFGYETETGYQSLLRTTVARGNDQPVSAQLHKFKVEDTDNNGSVSDEFDQLCLWKLAMTMALWPI